MIPSLMLGLALAVGAPAPKKEAPKKEPPTPVGTWLSEKVVAGGKELPAPPGAIEFNFTTDGQLRVNKGNGAPSEPGAFKVDATKDPAEIDITESRAGRPDRTIVGVFKIDGDTMTLAISEAGDRPKAFESPAGSQVIVFTFKRVKKD
jgi:uncharacterized protein (TIGR03067 family)